MFRIPWRVQTQWERLSLWRRRFSSGISELVATDRTTQASLMALGDIALYQPWHGEKPGLRVDPFERIRPILQQADLCTANLETVFCRSQPPPGQFGARLRADPSAAHLLADAGIHTVNVANNHCLDFGSAALAESLRILASNGIEHTGTRDPSSVRCLPLLKTVGGLRVAVVGYTDDFIVDEEYPGETAPSLADGECVLEDIQSIKPNVDALVVHLHWGYEFQLYPMLCHRDLARRFADAGADVVLCHHAHVPMGLEFWNNSVIAHGLGNFFFPADPTVYSGHPLVRRSFVLRVGIDRRGPTEVEIVPTYVSTDGIVELCQAGERREMLGILNAISQGLDEDSHLQHIETDRTVREGYRLASQLIQFAVEDDSRSVEVARFLSTPRQRAITKRLASMPDGCFLAQFLVEARECGANPKQLKSWIFDKMDHVNRTLSVLTRTVRTERRLPGRCP